MLRMGVVIVVVLAMVGGVLAVAGFEPAAPARPDDSAALGEFRYGVAADCITLNPQNTSSLTDFRVIDCLFEGLLGVDAKTLELEPAVAVAMPEVSADGRVYTFTLRQNAKWSNGDAVTAHDFVYAWQRAVTYDFAAVYSGLFYVIEGAEDFYHWREQQLKDFDPEQQSAEQAWAEYQRRFDETVGIKAVDDFTLRVTLTNPTAYFPQLCSFGTLFPNHRASVEAAVTLDPQTGRASLDGKYFTEAGRLVSNGPFKLTEWNLRRRLVMDANPYYWNRASLRSGRITQTVIEENDGLLLVRYLDGDFDWLPELSSVAAVRVIEAKMPGVHVQPRAGVEFYAFNTRPTVDGKPNPLADVRVRKALAMAVDRKALVEKVTRLNQPVANSFVPVGAVAGYDPPVDAHIRYDPAEAKRLLAEAGYPDGAGFPPVTLIYNIRPENTRIAIRLCNEWKNVLGIDVRAESNEWRAYLDKRRNGRFHIARSSWYGDYQDPTTWLDLLRGNDPNNASGYNNPAYDAKLAEAGSTLDPAARFALLQDAERMMLQDQALLPLYQVVSVHLYDPEKVLHLDSNAWNAMNLGLVEVLPDDE